MTLEDLLSLAAQRGVTLRVVRFKRRTPIRSSRFLMIWLSADWVMPSFAAARVKLRSRATARKATRSLSSSRFIHKPL